MSYPQGSNSPYGNTPYGNGPYGPQPQQPYGYPQQAQGGHPTYPYPQQPVPGGHPTYGYPPQGQSPFDGGPAGAPGEVPGKVRAVRLMMIAIGAIQTALMLIGVFGLAFAARQVREAADSSNAQLGIGLLYTLVAIFLIIGVAGVILGVQLPKGSGSLRIISIVWGALIIVCGLVAITTVGFLWVGFGGVVIALLAQPETVAYFNRPQY